MQLSELIEKAQYLLDNGKILHVPTDWNSCIACLVREIVLAYKHGVNK